MSKELIFVTGASRGIGAAIAFELAVRGYEVGCLSRSGELPRIDGVNADVAARWHAAAADVTDPRRLAEAMRALVEQLKLPVAGLVNNAGLHTEAPSVDLPLDDFRRLMEINAISTLAASQHVHPFLKARGGGLIVNIGSFYDKLGVRRNVSYCASKAAVGAITRCLAVEWAGDDICVINVAPGYIATDLNREAMNGPLGAYLQKRIPRRSPGSPRDIGVLVASFFQEGVGYLTGETIYIDGAQAVAI